MNGTPIANSVLGSYPGYSSYRHYGVHPNPLVSDVGFHSYDPYGHPTHLLETTAKQEHSIGGLFHQPPPAPRSYGYDRYDARSHFVTIPDPARNSLPSPASQHPYTHQFRRPLNMDPEESRSSNYSTSSNGSAVSNGRGILAMVESMRSSGDQQFHGNSSASSSSSSMSKKTDKGVKYCGVCGDQAKSFHFGGLSCDSCKAFFRRSVQNDAYKNFFCTFEKNCEIKMSSRKTCQFCRFEKCLQIGMEKSWVMTGEEREKLLKTRLEKKRKTFEVSNGNPGSAGSHYCLDTFEPDDDDKNRYMESDEQRDIELLVNAYRESYEEIPYAVDDWCASNQVSGGNCRIISMFSTIVKRMFVYARKLPGFIDLPIHDQGILLRGGILEMCLLRGAMVFDPDNKRWPDTTLTMYKNCPTLNVEHMKHLVSPKLFGLHMDFIRGVQELKPDESTVMLLSAIVLICPDRKGLSAPEQAATLQEKYLQLSKKYMMWRYGPRNARVTYPKLLMKLVDLQSLNDNRNEGHILLNSEEILQIQKSLGSLCLEPFKAGEKGTSSFYPYAGGVKSEDEVPEDPPPSTSTVSTSPETGPSTPINPTGVASSLKTYLMGEADCIGSYLNDEDDGYSTNGTSGTTAVGSTDGDDLGLNFGAAGGFNQFNFGDTDGAGNWGTANFDLAFSRPNNPNLSSTDYSSSAHTPSSEGSHVIQELSPLMTPQVSPERGRMSSVDSLMPPPPSPQVPGPSGCKTYNSSSPEDHNLQVTSTDIEKFKDLLERLTSSADDRELDIVREQINPDMLNALHKQLCSTTDNTNTKGDQTRRHM